MGEVIRRSNGQLAGSRPDPVSPTGPAPAASRKGVEVARTEVVGERPTFSEVWAEVPADGAVALAGLLHPDDRAALAETETRPNVQRALQAEQQRPGIGECVSCGATIAGHTANWGTRATGLLCFSCGMGERDRAGLTLD